MLPRGLLARAALALRTIRPAPSRLLRPAAPSALHVRAPGVSFASRHLATKTGGEAEDKPAQQPSRLRVLFKQYGLVFLSTYLGVYLCTLGTMYELVASDWVSAGNAIDLLRQVGLDRFVDVDKIDPRLGNFGVAWILTKFTEPARFLLTAAVTPRIARWRTGVKASSSSSLPGPASSKSSAKTPPPV